MMEKTVLFRWSFVGVLGLVSGLLVAGLLVAGTALADNLSPPVMPESKGPQPPVSTWNGSYGYSIALEVPGFRGLEPGLSLTYNSNDGVRSVGRTGTPIAPGWSLKGVSVIERMSGSAAPPVDGSGNPTADKAASGQGAPAFGGSTMPADSYALDGQELVACAQIVTPASTPSCAVPVAVGQTGYSGRVETYERIRQIAGSNSWEVTSRTGIISTYTSYEGSNPAATFRWYRTRTADRYGNRVDYAWSCLTQTDCTLATISYVNQGSGGQTVARIVFHAEARDETLSYTSGGSLGNGIRTIGSRFRTIAIERWNGTGFVATHAYKLTYDANTSSSTGLRRLVSVQKVGFNNETGHRHVGHGRRQRRDQRRACLSADVLRVSRYGFRADARQ